MYKSQLLIMFLSISYTFSEKYDEKDENPYIKIFDNEHINDPAFPKIEIELPYVAVSTLHGWIIGRKMESSGEREHFYAFRGIPYAHPPIGDLRFSPPVSYSKPPGIIDATKDRSVCMQITWDKTLIIGSEDCLFINIYVPNVYSTTRLPVLVNIHGGAFLVGNGQYREAGPDYILDSNVIYVSMNYRLGLLGFLSTEDMVATGNFGLKDQLLALKWINDNIFAFGGNPKEVTVMGNSAGGASVSYLLQTPLAKGWIKRGIILSGNSLGSWSLERSPREIAFDIGKILGINTYTSQELLAKLRALPAEDIILASNDYSFAFEDPFNIQYIPVQEPRHSASIIADKSYRILSEEHLNANEIMIGFTSAEGIAFSFGYDPNDYTDEDVLVSKSMHINDPAIKTIVAEEILSYYFSNGVTLDNVIKFHTDDKFIRSAVKFMELTSKRHKVYGYKFTYMGELGQYGPRISDGVNHTEDLNYLFKHPYEPEIISEDDALTRRRWCKFVTNFVTYGDPTPHIEHVFENITWKSASQSQDLYYLEFGENLSMETILDDDNIMFWDELFALYGNPPYDTY